MSSIGVDISSDKISIVEMSRSRKGFVINNAAIIKLKPKVITKGEIQDTAALSKEISNTWSRNKFRSRKAITGIATQRAIAKEIDIPTVNDKELEKAIKYQISDYLPISADNVIYDYYIMNRSKDSSKVMLTGAIRSVVDKVVESFKKAKVVVDAIDLNCFSLFRLINFTRNFGAGSRDKKNDNICIFNFGWEVSILGIIKDNDLRKPRFSTIGKKTLIDNLCKKLQKSEQECIKILDGFDFSSIDEKEGRMQIDNTVESSLSNSQSLEDNDGADAISESIIKTAGQLINDLKLTIDNFLQDDRKSTIGSIVVTGERIKGLEQYITKKLRYNVERLNIAEYFSIDQIKKKPDFKDKKSIDIADDLAISVGLALRGLI